MKLLLVIFSLLSLQSPAQDLSGIWTGYLQTSGIKLPYELAISDDAEKTNGYSQTIYLENGIENIGIKTIKIISRKRDFFLEDGKLVFDNYKVPSIRSKLFGSLVLTIKNSIMVLQGKFKTRSLDMRDKTSYEGEIFLEKQTNTFPTRFVTKLNELNLLNSLSFVAEKKPASTTENLHIVSTNENSESLVQLTNKNLSTNETQNDKTIVGKRQTVIVNSIYVNSDSLELSLYDNGTVDGDIVSVFLNEKLIISKGKLTTQAIKFTVTSALAPGDSLLLVMYAENLGSIPPNTGLLIIYDGKEKYEVRFSADMEKNSGIVFRKKTGSF